MVLRIFAMSATDELILNHREYVRKLARDIHRKLPKHASYDDIVAYGEVGLVEAATNFDPLSGVAFTTFAFYRIRGAIFDGIRKMSGLTPALRKQMAQDAGMDAVAQDSASAPAAPGGNENETLAKSFNESIKRLGVVFLVANATGEGSPLDQVDNARPEEAVEQAEMMAKLKEALAKLDADQMRIVQMFYFEQKSMSEIGAAIGKDKATVSRRHAKAIEVLAQAMGPPG
jgi:RNA polymerase sigma factor for flagellar operon FliA